MHVDNIEDVTARGFDYVVIGGGSAGAAVAARLSEDPDVTVALVEAGPDDRNLPEILQLLGIAWIGDDTWSATLADHRAQTLETLGSVSLLPTSSTRLATR